MKIQKVKKQKLTEPKDTQADYTLMIIVCLASLAASTKKGYSIKRAESLLYLILIAVTKTGLNGRPSGLCTNVLHV